MKKTFKLLVTSLILLTPLTACSNSTSSEQSSTVKVTEIKLNVSTLTLGIGDTFTLEATVLPENASNKAVRFQSSNTSVASVNSSGVITAKNLGKAVISAISLDSSKTAVCKITVSDGSSVDPDPDPDPDPQPTAKYTVSFNSNGGSGSMSAVTNIDKGTNYQVPSNGFTAPAGYEFFGWKVNNEGTLLSAGNYITINSNVTLYAQWSVADDPDAASYFDYHDLSLQDYTVLHCWSWKMSEIINNLDNIKNAGFKTIQISPMQPQLDYYDQPNGNWEGQWWKVYQPLGFSIAQSGQNVLGAKSDLQNMCTQASARGIKVIVDVVANHLAGGNDKQLNWNVQHYEPDIYSQNLIHTLGDKTADQDPKYNTHTDWIVQGAIGGFPDLQTESPVVQQRVLSLLKEYIDVGVSGFRFDAAKHIETPDDGEYASNFWPTVLNGATSYAQSKGKDKPYYYGEILTTPGTKRSFDWYTKYMSVTDDEEGTKVIDAVNSNSVGAVTTDRYKTTLEGKYLMLWGESHDTYANTWGYTKDMDQESIDKAYVIQSTRARANSLYFARATHGARFGYATTDAYKSNLITCANKFHTTLVNLKENIFAWDKCYVNERGTRGVAIVGMNNSSNTVSVTLQQVKSGTYINLLDGKTYTVNNKNVTVSLVNDVALLIRSDIYNS